MSNTNNNGGANGPQPTKDIVAGYAETLAIELAAADSGIKAAEKRYKGKVLARNYATCCLVKAEKTQSYYANVDNCVVTTGQKDSELIRKGITGLITKSEDLSTKLKEGAKTIKDLKNLIAGIEKKGRDLKEVSKEEKRCNPKIHKGIEDALGAGKWDDFCTKLAADSAQVLDTANKCLDGMIDLAGFAKFSNVYSLSEFGEPLEKLMAELKKNIAENIKNAGKNREEAQTKLTNILKELSIVKFDDAAAEAGHEGIKCIHDEVCDYVDHYDHLDDPAHADNPCPKTPDEAMTSLMDLCKKVIKDTFSD